MMRAHWTKTLGLAGFVAALLAGSAAYASEGADEELGLLADSARAAAERAVATIDDALAFIEASNRRIAALERKAAAGAAKLRKAA